MVEIAGDPCAELTDMLSENNDSFRLVPVCPKLVLKTGKRMRKSKSMGKDDIPGDLFLLSLPYMLPAVTHVYNLSIVHAKFPAI